MLQLQCFLFLLVIAIGVEYPTAGVVLPAILEIYLTIYFGTLAAIMLGLLISAIVPNVNTVIYLVFVVIMFQMIFGQLEVYLHLQLGVQLCQ